jgi:hypothetical protein
MLVLNVLCLQNRGAVVNQSDPYSQLLFSGIEWAWPKEKMDHAMLFLHHHPLSLMHFLLSIYAKL